jgi:hypothetical protein
VKVKDGRSVADDPHAPRQVTSEHRKLDVFLGRWRVSGTTGLSAPAETRLSGEDSYEWLPGGFFMANRWHHHLDTGQELVGTGVLGHLPEAPMFFAQSFDSLGHERRYDLSVEGRVWSYLGPWERATLEFADDGQSFTARWEMSRDGEGWTRLCDLKLTKLGA